MFFYRQSKRGNAVTIPLWGDEGELAFPETKSRDTLELLRHPVVLKQDPSRYQLMAAPKTPSFMNPRLETNYLPPLTYFDTEF